MKSSTTRTSSLSLCVCVLLSGSFLLNIILLFTKTRTNPLQNPVTLPSTSQQKGKLKSGELENVATITLTKPTETEFSKEQLVTPKKTNNEMKRNKTKQGKVDESDTSGTSEEKSIEHIVKKVKIESNNQKARKIEPEPKVDQRSKSVVTKFTSNGAANTAGLYPTPMEWNEFVKLPFDRNYIKEYLNKYPNQAQDFDFKPFICPKEINHKLSVPRLSQEEFDWCTWALNPQGGNAVVGKSWGKLNNQEKLKFDASSCNTVQNGKNPSCDDSWGDLHIKKWLSNSISSFNCEPGRSSQLQCYRNDNLDYYCEIENAQINFARVRKVSRGAGMTPSKVFDTDFLSTDCKAEQKEKDFPFPYLYSNVKSSDKCDYVYNGTLLLYSHDDIRNLGHTLNDVMNIWIMLWLSRTGKYSKQIDMLNIDSFKLGHNFDDEPNAFFLTYYKSLRDILKGATYAGKTLCVKHLLIQPIPPRFFIWESWFIDLPCSFFGPSSLYQRWNLDVRKNYGLINSQTSQYEGNKSKKIKVLLIVRNEHSNLWGNQRTSRNYKNLPELATALEKLQVSFPRQNGLEIITQDLSKLSFEEQIKLISEVSIMVGMHGAGIASSMHMSIGSKYCCGVVEIYPKGEFSPIRGHGNMVRKMGIFYDRMDISGHNSYGDGAVVPVDPFIEILEKMIKKVDQESSCILSDVIENPYLEF